jgi:hypothetical protein
MPYRAIAKQMKGLGLVSNTKHLKPISSSQWEKDSSRPILYWDHEVSGSKICTPLPAVSR